MCPLKSNTCRVPFSTCSACNTQWLITGRVGKPGIALSWYTASAAAARLLSHAVSYLLTHASGFHGRNHNCLTFSRPDQPQLQVCKDGGSWQRRAVKTAHKVETSWYSLQSRSTVLGLASTVLGMSRSLPKYSWVFHTVLLHGSVSALLWQETFLSQHSRKVFHSTCSCLMAKAGAQLKVQAHPHQPGLLKC